MPSKRLLIIIAITVIAFFIFMGLIIGIITHVPVKNLFWMPLTGFIGATIGVSIALLIFRLAYSQSLDGKEKQLSDINIRKNTIDKLSIDYELFDYDVLSFYLYKFEHYSISGKARKMIRKIILVTAASELIAAAVIMVIAGRSFLHFSIVLAAFAIFTITYYLISPVIFRRKLRRKLLRDYKQFCGIVTGKHEFSISPESIVNLNNMGESTTLWDTIESVITTDKYIFFMIINADGYILPKRAFPDNKSSKQFFSMAHSYWKKAKATNSPTIDSE